MAQWQHNEPDEHPPLGRPVFGQVAGGVGIVAVMHLVAVGIMAAMFYVANEFRTVLGPQVAEMLAVGAMGWFMLFGLVQLFYLLPVFGVAMIRHRPVAVGIVIGAGLTFTLQGACYGLFFTTLTSGSSSW